MPFLPDEDDYWISTDEDRIKYAQAKGADCSLDFVRRLSADHDVMLLLTAAKNPLCHKDALAHLARSPFLFVRETVATSTIIDEASQNTLMQDPEPSVRAALFSNEVAMSRIGPEAWLALGKDRSAQARAALAASPLAPTDLLAKLADDKTQMVRMGAAGNPRTPNVKITQRTPNEMALEKIFRAETLAELEEFVEPATNSGNIATVAVIRALDLKLITPKEARKRLNEENLTGGAALWVKGKVGTSEYLPDDVLATLIDIAADRYLSSAIFNGAKFTSEQIVTLAASKQSQTVWSLLHQYPLSPEILEAASTAPSYSVRLYSSYEYPRPLPTGLIFTEDRRGSFATHYPQAVVANHPLTPLSVVDRLKGAKSKYVRAAALSRPETTLPELEAAALDSEPVIRAAAAAHPRTSPDSLYRLAGDENAAVREAVAENPSAPDSARTLLHLSKQ